MPRGASDRQDEQYVALWPRHVRFAREKAKAMGYAVSGGHGIWQLSDEAPLALRRVVPAVSVTFYVDDEGAPVSAQIRLEGVLPTIHTIRQGDARDLSWLPDSSIQLAVTSCPYFDLKAYEEAPGQMADAENYETFLEMLEAAWAELYRVLEPGGNALINVGDVARYENAGTGAFLGKPNQPGGIIKSDNEYILRFRKPGAYRKPTADQARLSHIPMDECQKLFRSVWDDVPGARATG